VSELTRMNLVSFHRGLTLFGPSFQLQKKGRSNFERDVRAMLDLRLGKRCSLVDREADIRIRCAASHLDSLEAPAIVQRDLQNSNRSI
jgi:hypothetical protein